ncbi:hypothetical protein ASPCAL11489 [Aspergillus calidoustus]|uniref:Uncharacterized protein n=1 Tax=Aspergillus calidoustus TaxID=454130 RepID=A0A0U5G813_ASPCI|nr:hypothetical protein ASPCAL11489 [Aspergillus calidoustus]
MLRHLRKVKPTSTTKLIDLKIKPGVYPIIFFSTIPDSTDLVFAENLANTVYRTLRTVYQLDTKKSVDSDVLDIVFGQFPLHMDQWTKKRTMVDETAGEDTDQ